MKLGGIRVGSQAWLTTATMLYAGLGVQRQQNTEAETNLVLIKHVKSTEGAGALELAGRSHWGPKVARKNSEVLPVTGDSVVRKYCELSKYQRVFLNSSVLQEQKGAVRELAPWSKSWEKNTPCSVSLGSTNYPHISFLISNLPKSVPKAAV